MIMYNRVIFIFFISIYSLKSYSQTIFKDTLSSLPIGGVNIYDNNGNLVAFTDIEGFFQLLKDSDKKIEDYFPFSTQHISYESKVITKDLFKKNKIIKLIPKSILLEEVAVQTKSSDVILIKGFFRFVETFNLQHKYYIDGIAEYYIPTNSNKVKFKLIDYRVFCDSTVLKEFKDKMGNYFKINYIPEISKNSILVSSTNYKIQNIDNNKSDILKGNVKTGYIVHSKDPEQIQICIDLNSSNIPKKQKLFNLEANTYSDIIIENYSSASTSNIGVKNLASVYQNVISSIKRKSEFGHLPYEGAIEFYVLERSTISFKDFDKKKKELSSNIYKKPLKSKFNNKYWEELEHSNIPTLNNSLSYKLGRSLKLVK